MGPIIRKSSLMQVLVLNSVPSGLRGDVTRWFMELAPGVYVGRVSARVRDALWERIVAAAGRGRALMVYPAKNEQGYVVRTHQYDWESEDFDGLTFMLRPHSQPEREDDDAPKAIADRPPKGWSTAARRRRFGGRG